jgi:phosphoglycerate dehydrogenase-like enzyme
MRIVAIKPHPDTRADASYRVPGTGDPDGSIPERIVGDDGLLDAAHEADILVLTMPLTDASRGVIGREVLAALPQRAWLINVSRGALVDEPALLEALREGRLAGAVLDVFGEEPLPADSPWWDAPNVIVTPHASGHTLRFFDELVVENVRRYLAGEPLLNPVDPERGY